MTNICKFPYSSRQIATINPQNNKQLQLQQQERLTNETFVFNYHLTSSVIRKVNTKFLLKNAFINIGFFHILSKHQHKRWEFQEGSKYNKNRQTNFFCLEQSKTTKTTYATKLLTKKHRILPKWNARVHLHNKNIRRRYL